jgi:hypothetical protein
MMIEDVKRTSEMPKRRRKKTLCFISEKERIRLSVGKENANKKGK